ncbi:MAG: hypothetical protein E7623_05375 [Ruminococcaceae bacterium]|nr:hypothetical protein [Oscillospiraceae bacterium]
MPIQTVVVNKNIRFGKKRIFLFGLCSEKVYNFYRFNIFQFVDISTSLLYTTHIFAETSANNGRISPIIAKLVGIAGICIIGKASEEGTLEPMHKCRGEQRSLETLVKSLEEEGFRSGKISIGHCQNESAAERLKELILAKFKNAQIEIHKFRGLCSFYAEIGGVLVGFEKA